MAPEPSNVGARHKTVKENHSQREGGKKFNKTQWRKHKYSHKAKLEQFEERRRMAVVHRYFKDLKKNGQTSTAKDVSECCDSDKPNNLQKRVVNVHQLAEQELERKSQEKEKRRMEKELQKAEKERAIKKYHKEKLKKYIKLSKKTKKGQPVMAGRMELLLEKIQNSVGANA